MKVACLFWITVAGMATADTVSELRRQVAEQERQIRQLEIENDRLRYMLTEAEVHSDDPLYGARVSGKLEGKPEAADGKVHVVARGETLSTIAAANGVDVGALAEMNRIDDPSLIRPGQRIRLPESLPAGKTTTAPPTMVLPPKPLQHVVLAGENLYRISLRYEVALDELLAANPAIDPRRLRVGQKVRIPQGSPMLAGGD